MGVRNKLPDFIIAGAPRSGTTWLCALLSRHPHIGLAQPIAPEPKFFLVDDLYARGLEYYSERWFAPLTQPVLGEKSTNYLENACCAERIAEALPAVKLIFILRDPVQRAFSNYRWSVMNGHETETFARALAREADRPVPSTLRYARPFDYLVRGRYADLLRPYLDRFDRRQILVLRFEDIGVAPDAVAVTIHDFLGVSRRAEDGLALPPVNEAQPGDLDVESGHRLRTYFQGPNAELAALTGLDVSAWSRG